MFLKGEETDGRKPSKFFGIQMRCSDGGGRGRGKRKAKSSINQAEQEGEGWEMISLRWEEGKRLLLEKRRVIPRGNAPPHSQTMGGGGDSLSRRYSRRKKCGAESRMGEKCI